VPKRLNNLKSTLDGFPPYTHDNFYMCPACAFEFIDAMLHAYQFEKLSGGLLEEFFRLKNPKAKAEPGIPAKFPTAPKPVTPVVSEPNFDMDTEI
jgi:hypothetical protein